MPQGATAKSAAAPVHKKDTICWQEYLVQILTRGVGICMKQNPTLIFQLIPVVFVDIFAHIDLEINIHSDYEF